MRVSKIKLKKEQNKDWLVHFLKIIVIFVILTKFTSRAFFQVQKYTLPVYSCFIFLCGHLYRKMGRDNQMGSICEGHVAILCQFYITDDFQNKRKLV